MTSALSAAGCEGVTLTVSVEVCCPAPATSAARQVAEMFALEGGRRVSMYRSMPLVLEPGSLTAVIGPSGAGKTVFLEAVAERLASAGVAVERLDVASLDVADSPAVEQFPGVCLPERLEALSRCGLADALALITPARSLSGGQRHRLALARALLRARRREGLSVLLVDELGASLDGATARGLFAQLRRAVCPESGIAAVVATPRSDLLGWLAPDRTIAKPLLAPGRWTDARTDGAGSAPTRWPIRRGTIADYDALGRFHYLAGRPAAHKRVLTIRTPRRLLRDDPSAPETAAVLVVSPPVLQCRGRNVATCGRYSGRPRRQAVARLNAELECISRVVVHPTFRGAGLAVRLVRRALRTTPVRSVEALAAMGAVHPFFIKAGMRDCGTFPGRTRRYVYYLWQKGRDGR
jgi:ABC-type ATPase with predicted acetyltransferase domain